MILPENILTPIGNLKGSLTSGGLIPGVPIVIGTASGNPAHIEDGTNTPINDLKINVEPSQEGTGTPSPTNPRNINIYNNAIINISPTADPNDGINYNYDWNDLDDISGGTIDPILGKIDYTYYYYRITNVTAILDTKAALTVTPNNLPASGYTLATNPFLCNILKPSNYSGLYDDHIHFSNKSTIGIYLSEEVGSNISDWNNWLQNNPLYIAYKLETPLILESSQITMLLNQGENYIQSNIGNIDLKYIIELQSFLQWIYDNLYNP